MTIERLMRQAQQWTIRPATSLSIPAVQMMRKKKWKALSSLEPTTVPTLTLPPVEPMRRCAGCREMSYTRSHARACPLAGGR